MERDLSDKVLFHIVDSSMFTVDGAVMNQEPNSQLISGTMMHGLKVYIGYDFSHCPYCQLCFSIQDYLPHPDDGYRDR